MGKIKISVIVPTYNRLELLKKQVKALLNQTVPFHLYEVFIVNDGSSDGTEAYLNEVQENCDNVRVFHNQNGGPARARNTALNAAKGDIIAFTDDDCEVDLDWLATIFHEFKGDLVGLQGLTYTDRADVTPLTHQIDNETGHNSVPTCNAAYRRDLLNKIGGFDETFPYPHNEDADIGWQMQEMGEVKFCSNMRVYHPPRVDKFKKVAKRMNILDSEFTLFKKNPELYRKYRDKNPLKHIYNQVFIKTMWYYTYSRIKYWRKPKLMIQGLALTAYWYVDLIRKYPRYRALYQRVRVDK
ncbi:glycosyltransferase family 2 protein [Ekhidna sp.]